jgi:hypothetical protein
MYHRMVELAATYDGFLGIEPASADFKKSRAKRLGNDLQIVRDVLAIRGATGSRRSSCPLLAQSGHELMHRTCPLSGVKRTCPFALHMSANDPKRTLATPFLVLV